MTTGAELSQDEVDLLCATAYNHLLMHRHQDALVIYRFLSHVQPQDSRWSLGQAYCHLGLGHHKQARALLKEPPSSRLHRWLAPP